MSAPDEITKVEKNSDLKGKPIADKVIAEKTLPKREMPAPEKMPLKKKKPQ